MEERYYPVTSVVCEHNVKQSTFIALLFPRDTEQSIKQTLVEIRKEHSGAAHVAYAYIIGDHDRQDKGMSDDGEPAGTAGKPILSLLEGNGYINVLVVVVRYFGGIKLGTGGLVRAYSGAAALAVNKTRFQPFLKMTDVSIVFPYAYQGQLTAYLNARNLVPEKADYSDIIRLTIPVKSDEVDDVVKALNNVCAGQAAIDI